MTDVTTTRHSRVGNSDISVGRFTYGFENMQVLQWGEGASLKIGGFCSIASGLKVVLGGNHRADWITTFPFGHIFQNELGGEDIVGHPQTKGDVSIGNDVWLGRNVTIMSGISIADGAIIAANSTVVKDVGAYQIWGGNPAKLIKSRFDDEIIAELIKLKWWDFPVEKIKKITPILSSHPSVAGIREIADV